VDHLEDLPFRQFGVPLPGRGPGEVAVLDFGRLDEPVAAVFLHANGFNANTYRRLLGAVSRFGRILAYDQRGHGATTLQAQPEGRRDWLDIRDDLLAFVETLDLRGIALCGHSMGGTVSLFGGREAPERIDRLLLLDPVMIPKTPAPEGENASPMIAGALRRRAVFASRADARAAYFGRGAFATWPEAMIEDYVEGGFRDLPGGGVELACAPAWEASNYGAQAHDSWGALAAYPGPVRIMAADTGSTCHEPSGFDLESMAPRVSLERIQGTTHFLPMERPDLVTSALRDTLLATR
jgi:pimeloyl-ACP methyl ester carboxylesterase